MTYQAHLNSYIGDIPKELFSMQNIKDIKNNVNLIDI